MPNRMIELSDQEVQRIEAILLDRDRDEALRFLNDVIKKKLHVTSSHACGPKPV